MRKNFISLDLLNLLTEKIVTFKLKDVYSFNKHKTFPALTEPRMSSEDNPYT